MANQIKQLARVQGIPESVLKHIEPIKSILDRQVPKANPITVDHLNPTELINILKIRRPFKPFTILRKDTGKKLLIKSYDVRDHSVSYTVAPNMSPRHLEISQLTSWIAQGNVELLS